MKAQVCIGLNYSDSASTETQINSVYSLKFAGVTECCRLHLWYTSNVCNVYIAVHCMHCTLLWNGNNNNNKQTFYLLEVENKTNTMIKLKLLPEGYQRANSAVSQSVLAAYDVFMHNWKTFYNINTCNINKNKKILKKQMKKRALVFIHNSNKHTQYYANKNVCWRCTHEAWKPLQGCKASFWNSWRNCCRRMCCHSKYRPIKRQRDRSSQCMQD